ncbi:MAG: hypothetical protein AAF702_24605 [Chloroflexota bacterium]
MNKFISLLIGATAGAAVGLAIIYLFGPDETMDGENQKSGPYLSRLGGALEAGRQAAAERETELLRSFEEAKRSS